MMAAVAVAVTIFTVNILIIADTIVTVCNCQIKALTCNAYQSFPLLLWRLARALVQAQSHCCLSEAVWHRIAIGTDGTV